MSSHKRTAHRAALIAVLAATGCAPQGQEGESGGGVVTPVHVAERKSAAVEGDVVASSVRYASDLKAQIGLTGRDDFRVKSNSIGLDNRHHVRLQQTHDGIPVWGSDVVVHASEAAVSSMSGNVAAALEGVDTSASVGEGRAMAIAKGDYASEATRNASLAYARETAELVVLPSDKGARLAWHVEFFTELQNGIKPGLWNYFIDADTGTILKQFNGIHTLEQASGPGGNQKVDRFWDQKLDVVADGSSFKMETGLLQTVDMGNSTSGGTVVTGDSLDPIGDAAINDAHGFAEITVNMLSDWFGKNSIDDNGFQIRSRVHYGSNYENAFWDGQQMTYGDGDTFFYALSGDVDVVSHEIHHGYTTFHSDLTYSGKSGGLNESFSDVAGTAADFFIHGELGNEGDWLLGADVFQDPEGALRYMCNPPEDGKSIGHADDYTSGMDVHYSSGVSNKAFCLASRRLSSGSPDGEATPEGVKRAAKAWFEANASYWTSSTDFTQGCQGVIDAASGLGFSADEISALRDSWEDVGVYCDGNVEPIECDETLTESSGEFTSPNYPDNYPDDVDYTWCVEPASGAAATLHFDDFDTESGYDFVRVRNESGEEVAVTSGTDAPADVTSTLIAVTFTSDGSVNRKGFKASWTSGDSTNEAPTASITSPADGDVLSGTVEVTAVAEDSDGDVRRVEFELPDGSVAVDDSAPYSTSWNSTSVQDGSGYGISVTAFDDLGAASEPASVAVEVSNDTVSCVDGRFDATDVPVDIPDDDEAGVASSVSVAGSGGVGSLALSLDITHTWRGDLRVVLVSPAGTEHVVADREGSYRDDLVITDEPISAFHGEAAAGDWTLRVSDHYSRDTGTINSWSLDIVGDCSGGTGWSASDEPNLDTVDDGEVCTSVDVAADGDAADVKVDLSGSHDWRSSLSATLEHAGTVVEVFGTDAFPSGAGEFSLSSEPVPGFSGGASGTWTLCVVDTDGFGDTGVLGAWGVHN